MEHLSLEVFDLTGDGSQYAYLEDGTSVTITDTSEVFARGDVWSLSFSLNTQANAHILGSAGDLHGSRLHELIHRRRARLWVEGHPLLLGYLTLSDEAEVDADGNIDVGFESGQKTFDELIDGAKANQVPLMSDVLIGLALWRKRKVTCTVKLKASAVFDKNAEGYFSEPSDVTADGSDGIAFSADGEATDGAVQEYPRMVFPRLEEGTFDDLTGDGLTSIDCINTDYAYDDEHPYCNIALCYQRQGYDRKQTDGTYITKYDEEPEAQRGYEYSPAYRLNSAPNFYVIYWLRCLMKHLGIYIEENQMMDVEDLRRLFFVNSNCVYKEPDTLRTDSADAARYGKYRFAVRSGKIQRLVPEFFGSFEKKDVDGWELYYYSHRQNVDVNESGFTCTDYKLESGSLPAYIKHIKIDIDSVEPWDESAIEQYQQDNGYLHRAYATPECFPDADISETIKALEDGFGIRLLFSDDYKRVRIVLLRNIFRSSDVQDVACEVIGGDVKVENGIRGFRMTYGESEDTHFYYKGFADMLPHKKELWQDNSDKHDYSKWKLDARYGDIIKRVNTFDKTCYVTPATGNAFGIKIDKNAKRYYELYPSLFGYADFMDAEDGDCTGEEETIETVTVGFRPAIMNDLNMEAEREGDDTQRFALFVDETMRPRRQPLTDGTDYNDPCTPYPLYGSGGLYDNSDESPFKSMMAGDGIIKPGEFAVRSDMFARTEGYRLKTDLEVRLALWSRKFPVTMNIDGYINEGFRLYLQDNFEPNDTGIAPIETHDWGLTLGIMRGSGDDAYVRYEGDPDDGEGNDTWRLIPGTSVTAHPDTCDNYGREWDYNGTRPGVGDTDGRVSLKLRAEKPNPYFDPTKAESSTNRRYLEIETESLRGRGLIDQFYKEYSYWTRNARIVRRTVRMELSQLLAIDKTKRVRVGDVTGFIRKMQYTVSKDSGLGDVTLEIMYI